MVIGRGGRSGRQNKEGAASLRWPPLLPVRYLSRARRLSALTTQGVGRVILVQTAEMERTNVAPGLTSCGEHCFPHVRYSRPSSKYYSGRIELPFPDLL